MGALLFWIAVLGAAALVFGLFGAWVADQRGRSPLEGLVVGALFGPLGVLVEALLPAGSSLGAGVGPGRLPDRDPHFDLQIEPIATPPKPARPRPAVPEAISRLRLD